MRLEKRSVMEKTADRERRELVFHLTQAQKALDLASEHIEAIQKAFPDKFDYELQEAKDAAESAAETLYDLDAQDYEAWGIEA
jgi:hypothetical protein